MLEIGKKYMFTEYIDNDSQASFGWPKGAYEFAADVINTWETPEYYAACINPDHCWPAKTMEVRFKKEGQFKATNFTVEEIDRRGVEWHQEHEADADHKIHINDWYKMHEMA